MKITFGIPTFGRPKDIISSASQIINLNHPDVIEIIIADQTPWESIESIWKEEIINLKRNPKIQYHQLNNPNLPAARNFILSVAKGEIIIWIDDDVKLPEEFIESHIQPYKLFPEKCIAVAGNPYHRTIDIDNVYSIGISNYDNFCTPHFKETELTPNWQQTMVGANHSVLRKYAIENKGYDENILGGYAEDSDFTFRLLKNNPDKYIVYNPKAWLIHLRSKSGGCRIESTNKWSEYATIIGPQICRIRHGKGYTIYSILRMSVFRKENIRKPWRQLSAWKAFFNSMITALKVKHNVKSILEND